MKKMSSLHRKWMKQPDYRREYEALEGEFALASAEIKARERASQSAIEADSRK